MVSTEFHRKNIFILCTLWGKKASFCAFFFIFHTKKREKEEKNCRWTFPTQMT